LSLLGAHFTAEDAEAAEGADFKRLKEIKERETKGSGFPYCKRFITKARRYEITKKSSLKKIKRPKTILAGNKGGQAFLIVVIGKQL